MKKIIKDFFVDKFNCDDDALVEELFSQLDPIMEDNYDEGDKHGFNEGHKKGFNDAYQLMMNQEAADRTDQSKYDFDRGYTRGKLDSHEEIYQRGFESGKLAGIYEEKGNNLKKDKNEQTENRSGYRRYTSRFLERILKAIR